MVEAVYPPEPSRNDDPHASVRAIELTRLRARLESPDRGGTVVLRGPRGVGKEALASDVVAAARTLHRAAVFEGRTPPAGGRSFHPFAELVRQAMGWAEQSGLSDALVDPLLADLGPVLDPEAADAAPVPSLDQKLRFFEAIRRLLTGVTERARMLAVVHDLERADGDTLELAGYLADNLFADPALEPGSGRPGLLLLIVRDDRSTPARAKDFLAELEERRTVETLRLTGLDLDGVRLYLQSPRVLEKVLAASEGIPREIDELFEALPSNVEQLFERRLDAMGLVERGVLRALSLSSRPAPARVIAAVTGLPLKDVALALAAHKDARILERKISNGELQFSFARRSNLEVTARTASADELAQLHGGWASALAEAGTVADPALLAHHQLRSTEPTRGVPLAIRAAETHAVAGAFDAAATLLENALPHAKGELRLTALARLSELASLRAKPREAVRWVELWKAELPQHDMGRALIREAELHNAVGDYDRARASLAEARRCVPDAQVIERAAIEGAEAEALYQRAHLDEAAGAAERGLAILGDEPADGTERTRIELANLLGKVAVAREDYGAASARFRQTFTAAERAGLGREAARALVNLGHAALRAGDHALAERTLLDATARARDAHDLSHLAVATLNLGVIAHLRSQLGQAIEYYRSCRSLFLRLGNRTQLARVMTNLATLYSAVGDAARARAHVAEALHLARATGSEQVLQYTRVVEGTVLAHDGQRAAAEAILRDAIVHQRRHGVERSTKTLLELAEIQLLAGDLAAASETMAEVNQNLDQVRAPRIALRAKVLRARLLGSSDHADGIGALEAVRSDIEKTGDRLLAIEVDEALALAYEQRGQRERARLLMASVEQLRRAVASELPVEMREGFLGRAAAVAAAARPVELVVPSAEAAPAVRPSHPPVPAVARNPEWERKYASIVGCSPKLHRVFHILDRVSQSDSTVLIVGESGTGKELVAEAVHKNSPRARGPFVKLNCAALVESLLLSELFGHERGAFTGAHQRKAGRFEMAAGGTIFLDEIGDISPKTQVSLLRVLQAREFERVGGGRPIKLEARVVCATNRNLAQMVREGTFREDLYYRLKGLSIELPPLRERPDDIEALALGFLERYALESGTPAKSLSRETVAMMGRYAWPGNVRELENVVRSVALFADTPTIEPHHFDEYRELFEDAPAFGGAAVSEPELPAPTRVEVPVIVSTRPERPAVAEVLPVSRVAEAPRPTLPAGPAVAAVVPAAPAPATDDGTMLSPIFHGGVPLAELKKKIQAEAIARALKLSRGNITKAAEILGMKRPRLSQIINANDELKALCQGVGR